MSEERIAKLETGLALVHQRLDHLIPIVEAMRDQLNGLANRRAEQAGFVARTEERWAAHRQLHDKSDKEFEDLEKQVHSNSLSIAKLVAIGGSSGGGVALLILLIEKALAK